MSDTFLCSRCGCRGIYKVLGNTKSCPNCGGTMYRQRYTGEFKVRVRTVER